MARQRHFLLKAVNPYRGVWLIAAISLFWVGLWLLRLENQSWHPQVWANSLGQLVSDEPTPVRIKVASVVILFSVI